MFGEHAGVERCFIGLDAGAQKSLPGAGDVLVNRRGTLQMCVPADVPCL
jgi:hypothetical protein